MDIIMPTDAYASLGVVRNYRKIKKSVLVPNWPTHQPPFFPINFLIFTDAQLENKNSWHHVHWLHLSQVHVLVAKSVSSRSTDVTAMHVLQLHEESCISYWCLRSNYLQYTIQLVQQVYESHWSKKMEQKSKN